MVVESDWGFFESSPLHRYLDICVEQYSIHLHQLLLPPNLSLSQDAAPLMLTLAKMRFQQPRPLWLSLKGASGAPSPLPVTAANAVH